MNIVYQAKNILARRDHSEFEMRTKLSRKGFDSSDINTVIQRLKKSGLINDLTYTENYINSILQTKKVGPNWLIQKLRQRGIPQDLTEQIIGDIISPLREQHLAEAAAKSWRRLHPRHATDHARLTRFLNSRGFSFEAINSALRHNTPGVS